MNELLSPIEMASADRATIDAGTPGIQLMETAGAAVAAAAECMAAGRRIVVLCGPGNNGGDGFVAGRLLSEKGYEVDVRLLGDAERLSGDARLAFESFGGPVSAVDGAHLKSLSPAETILIDALFGAGLDRPLVGPAAAIVEAVNGTGVDVLAADLPSGIDGASGLAPGPAINAHSTVTFFRKKPGHVLYPGRSHCGEVTVADIGIPRTVLDKIRPLSFENGHDLWFRHWRSPEVEGHKFDRGHVVTVSGPASQTGAGRLAADAALRAGAGLVTVACEPSAVLVNAAHLTAVMVKSAKGAEGLADLLSDRRLNAVVIGPGAGVAPETAKKVGVVLKSGAFCVLDADALTAFKDHPGALFAQIRRSGGEVVLTPHAGEFSRIFPDEVAADRLTGARAAAALSGAIVVLKGPDTIIAAPDGRVAINTNAPPWLATAGSGDVLAGIIAGLGAQGVPGFEAASMAVWMHGEAGRQAEPGLISEDLGPALRPVIAGLYGRRADIKRS